MTDNLGYLGVALPDGYKIQQDPRGRDVLVMTTNQADYLARLMAYGARQKREKNWDSDLTFDSLDDRGLAHMEEWRPVASDKNVVVWTKPGATVMVQNLDPGNLAPFEAYELSLVLQEAANYAARPTEETK